MAKYALNLAILTGLVAFASETTAAPNIVIVNLDDFGWGDFAVYGSEYSQTPSIDALAAAGTRFTQFYSGAPICSPSRAAFFTGQYAARSGVNTFIDSTTNNLQRDNANSLSLNVPSIAQAFHDGGYATGHFGKWHLGGGRDVGYATNPTPGTNVSAPRIVEYGYDQAWTQFEGLGNRIINVQDHGGTAAGTTTRQSAYFNGLNQSSDERGTGGGLDQIVYLERQYNATFMIDRAIEFLDDSKAADPDEPVFMNIWLDESHTPHEPPAALRAKYNALYPSLPQESRDYLAIVEYADQQIGRLINHVDQSGLGEETLIVVMADNGAVGLNAGNLNSTGPFRGSKGSLYEGGFREPLIARWTGNVASGRVDDDSVIWGADLFPTLASVAGVASPAGVSFDGEVMDQALLGVQSQTRSKPLFWNMNRGAADNHAPAVVGGAGSNGLEAFAMRAGDWKLLLNADGTSPELYNLANDPGESNNLAAQQPAIVEQMASQGLTIRYSTPSRQIPDTATPIVRLKAQDLASLGNGAGVGSWSDGATGDAFNGTLSQATASSRPTLTTGALQGKAVVTFDGDDSLQSSTTNSLPTPGQGITVFAVTTADTSGASAERLAQIGKSTGAAGQAAGLDVSTTPTSADNGGAGFRFNDGSSLYDTPLSDPGFHIVVWQVDDGQAYADAKMFVDGTLAANTFTGNGPTNTTNFSGNDLELILGTGRAANGALQPGDSFSGQVAEFLVYNDQLSKGQINLVANYLSSEYGLPFAYDTTLSLFDVQGLSWNGGAANFDAAWNAGDGAGGPAGASSNPFVESSQDLYLGNGGTAQFDNATNTSAGSRVNSLRVGTALGGFVVDGTEGNGTFVASGFKSLTIGNGSAPAGGSSTGDLLIGEGGFAGAVTWGSTGTFKIEGRLRVGLGGAGVFNQDAGVVDAGNVAGSLKYLGVGDGSGGHGTYNLNNGRLLPGGGSGGAELRQLRIGSSGAEGALNVGDGVGSAGTARLETRDDLFIGYEGGSGTLVIKSDGLVQLQTSDAEFRVANNNGATGLVVQEGGSVSTQALVSIGQGGNTTGEYRLSAGSLSTTGTVRIGAAGGEGKLRMAGSSTFSTSVSLFIGQSDNSGSKGLLELVGSNAAVQLGRLDNHLGNDETIRWVADASGVTPIAIAGSGGVERVQLQDPLEVADNSGANGAGALSGDGVALSLDLSALSGSRTLTLINNQTTQAITGFFEKGLSQDLYEEGELIAGTGFNGSVSITYVGGTGNDVVLNLTAGPASSADFDDDGDVDGSDFLTWQRGLGSAAPGDADGNGIVNSLDLSIWKERFGPALESGAARLVSRVPEPGAAGLLITAGAMLWQLRWALSNNSHNSGVIRGWMDSPNLPMERSHGCQGESAIQGQELA
ncbi:MAG: sulfatase-like hydrolase/transferase, partial [Pirellulales bacterium]|nr:sulfatase-like hydrolase/transferase [Pirellulales bacterium]